MTTPISIPYFCGHDTTPLPDLGPSYTFQFTNNVAITNKLGKSVGSTTELIVKTYSAAGTYASVFRQMQAASSTGTPMTDAPVSSATHPCHLQYALRGADIVLGIFGLALLLSLAPVAYLAHHLRSFPTPSRRCRRHRSVRRSLDRHRQDCVWVDWESCGSCAMANNR